MTFVIGGGGPTGVDLAGSLAELIRDVLRKDYPMLSVEQARVVLVESHDAILRTFPPSLQRKGQRRLERMGVEIKLGAKVAAAGDDRVTFKDGTRLRASTVV